MIQITTAHINPEKLKKTIIHGRTQIGIICYGEYKTLYVQWPHTKSKVFNDFDELFRFFTEMGDSIYYID